MRFKSYNIATITSIVHIYKEINKNSFLKLDLLARHLPINKYIKYIFYNGIEKGETLKKKKNSKNFLNSMKIEFLIKNYLLSVKFCKNGVIHIAGSKKDFDVKIFIFHINNVLLKLPKKIFSQEVDVNFSKYAMIKCNTEIDEPLFLNCQKIYEKITSLNDDTMIAIFENSENKHFSIKKNIPYKTTNLFVSYEIFNTGKLNFSGKLNPGEEIDLCYEFITKFIIDNIDEFMVKDIIYLTINLLKKNTEAQRSQEWFNKRLKCITSSEIYKALGKSKYVSKEKWLSNKVARYLKFDIDYTNKYMLFGIMMEPVAQKIYIDLYNEKYDKKIVLYETGFHLNKNSNFIGASPDGIIFKFAKNTDLIFKPKYDKLIDLYYKKKILEVYLLEIKCPSKWKKIISLKSEYPNYYYQIQTQMFVMNIPYVVFMNNKFVTFESEIEYFHNIKKKHIKSGVIGKKINEQTFIYPEKNLNILLSKKEILNKCENVKFIYWILQDMQILHIHYKKKWFENKLYNLKLIHKKLIKKIKDGKYGPEIEFNSIQNDN
jgi:putative phage-type endonuclease